MSFEEALQAAIVAALQADPGVAALVGEKIFDEVPEDDRAVLVAEPPYLYLGPLGWTRIETGGAPGRSYTFRLYACSTGFGRLEAWRVADAAAAALEGAEPALAGFAVVEPFRVTRGGDVINPDPKAAFVDVTTSLVRTA